MTENTSKDWQEVQGVHSFANIAELDVFLEKVSAYMNEMTREFDLILPTTTLYQLYLRNNPGNETELETLINENGPTFKQIALDFMCIGHVLKLKDKLLKLFPEFVKPQYLNILSSMFWRGKVVDFPRIQDTPTNFHVYGFTGHFALGLKFRISEQIGYVIFESTSFYFRPIIVMEDNDLPTSEVIKIPFGEKITYKYLGDGYVGILHQMKSYSTCYFACVSRDFVSVDRYMTYSCLFPMRVSFFRASFSGSVIKTLRILLKEKALEFTTVDESVNVENLAIFPMSLLSSRDISEELETAIREAADFMKENYAVIRKQLVDVAAAVNDVTFMTMARQVAEKYVNTLSSV